MSKRTMVSKIDCQFGPKSGKPENGSYKNNSDNGEGHENLALPSVSALGLLSFPPLPASRPELDAPEQENVID